MPKAPDEAGYDEEFGNGLYGISVLSPNSPALCTLSEIPSYESASPAA